MGTDSPSTQSAETDATQDDTTTEFVDDRHVGEPEETKFNFVAYAVNEDEDYKYLGLFSHDTQDDLVEFLHNRHSQGIVWEDGVAWEFEEIDVYHVGGRTTHTAPPDTPRRVR